MFCIIFKGAHLGTARLARFFCAVPSGASHARGFFMWGRLSMQLTQRTYARWALAILLVGAAALNAGCAGKGYKKIGPNSTAQEIYAEARDEMDVSGYDKAIPLWEQLEGKAAGTPLAQQAQLEKAYAYYKSGDRPSAVAALDRFEKLHPTSPAMDYALYLKGLINFNDDLGLLGFISKQDLSERDQNAAKLSLQAFNELLRRYPQSKYAEDAHKRQRYIINSLAQSEVNVARYYYSRKAYVAAINRAQTAIKDYSGTPAQEEALFYLVKSYEAVGMKALADDARRVYTASYPKGNMLGTGPKTAEKPWWQPW
jgi:outer membrane protein assembly factor BamD